MSRNQQLDEAREVLLQRLVDRMELPMVILGFVWLMLLIIEYVWGLHPLLERLSGIIWVVFILEFLLEFSIAPRKITYLSRNWLMIIALIVPALRIFRLLSYLRIMQGARLVRVFSSINRGMRALGASLGRHGFRYVAVLTLIVTFAGAAGMYAFERNMPSGQSFRSYPDALWWTAMIMTTLGSGYWPHTLEGRVLCIVLSLYAFSVFGYVTAALATFLVGREAKQDTEELPSVQSIAALREEIAQLREEIQALSNRFPPEMR